MITYKIIENGCVISEEKSSASKVLIMKGIEEIIKRNYYKIERIEEKENNEVIYHVY